MHYIHQLLECVVSNSNKYRHYLEDCYHLTATSVFNLIHLITIFFINGKVNLNILQPNQSRGNTIIIMFETMVRPSPLSLLNEKERKQ